MRLIDADKLKAKYPTHRSLCQKVDDGPTVEVTAFGHIEHGVIGDYEFFACDCEAAIGKYRGSDSEIAIPDEVMGNHVELIQGWAFAYNATLKVVTIPYGIRDIQEGAFSFCRKLESVFIPESLNCIEDNAFDNCPSLTSVTIPRRFEKRIKDIFARCPNLKNIVYTD